jgi:dihydroorotase-like cyclic amidohydrolase
MFLPDLVVRSRNVIVDEQVVPAAIHVRNGKIVGILDFESAPAGCPLDDAGDSMVMPGLVHTQVDPCEAQLASPAAEGGITTTVGSGMAGATTFVHGPDARTVEAVIARCHSQRSGIHIVGLIDSDALLPLYRARAERLPITAGTTADALLMAHTMSDRKNRELLWGALNGGLIQVITSGHAWPVKSSPHGLAAMRTVALSRDQPLTRLAQWMCLAPARLAGLTRKGAIAVGYDADLVVWNPDEELIVHRGQILRGAVQRTYRAGSLVFDIDRGSHHGNLSQSVRQIQSRRWSGPFGFRI